MWKGKTVILGVTGGIACYKAAALCSKLAQKGAEVRVIMTESATKFVAPLTFQTLSRHHVMVDTFDEKDASVVSHIDWADSADLVVVAPATANMLAKMAHGLADDMLSTTLLATTAPILVAPAMNVHMYTHPAVQANMQTLLERGVRFVEPGVGQLACGYVGKGRLAEPEEIMLVIDQMLHPSQPLRGRRVLVTAGGTVERIDPVRYITNDSSGKMGYAIAEAARDMGAEVTLVSAKTAIDPPTGVEVVRVVSTKDMLHAVQERFSHTDIFIKAAAVADYRPAETADRKIKKKAETLTLELVKNPDILQWLGENKRAGQLVVGFAAETNDGEQHALDKVRRKKSDLLVLNDVTIPGAGFGTDTNLVRIYDANGLVQALPMMGKRAVAEKLLELVAGRLQASGGSEA
ncbi:bifunctional phosphopantothenoylcysteine decarboxylase/phosphopantothenate--cysteine ligase CoaBC [Paenibacillus koleovorans]|uniref:bifunctional phosphopantothenoylcysteine decarboxylase/phosphopantothenate--cysteine ligase CoaBC n=1 Tax=Paenibacillus koleovorans TaxID=121608 RepID=UPI000FD98EBC|nr:bifunctional phosphopantothenoylcysteine decarboxylase/phosphopantothenate--cysteine ligase CoaBC [Paenibacillus koleovorans]